MVEFTSFDAKQGTAGPISVRRATAEDFGGDGTGLIKGGEKLAEFGKVLQKNQIKKENAGINQANIDNQGYGAELFRAAKENADANATDFTPNILAEYDKNMEAKLAAAPNQRVRDEMQADFTRTRNALVQKSSIFESVTRSKNEKNVFVSNGHKAGNVVFETPTEEQYEQTRDARQREIDNTSLRQHVKDELMRDEVKALRFKQYAGMLEKATNADQIDTILEARNGDELSKEGFARLGKAGKAKKRRFDVDARLAKVERRSAIRDAEASIRVANAEFSHGRVPDEATLKRTEQLVAEVGDPITSEMWFNVKTVGKAINGWQKLSSTELEKVIVGLERDTIEDGSTTLEGAKLDEAKRVLSRTLTGERQEQAKVDNTIVDAFDRIDKRLADGVDLSKDADVITILANLDQASPRLKQRIKEAFALNSMVDGLQDLSPTNLAKFINEQQANRNLSDINIVYRDAAKRVYADMISTVDKNYVDWVQKIDPALFPPLNQADPRSMKAREALMQSGADKYGKAPQFHTTSELKDIGAKLVEMTSEQQIAFIHGYTNNMTRGNAVIALTELSEVNPLMGFVGGGIASDPGYAVTAAHILNGQQRLANEGPKLIEELTSGTTKADTETAINTAGFGALENEELHPTHRAAVKSAALAIIASGAETDPVRALNMALGGTNDGFGGIQRINEKNFAAPVGVSSDMIEDAFENKPTSITALSIGNHPPRTINDVRVSAKQLGDAMTLERVGPDIYVVRMKSDGKILQGAPGSPYTLHITRERLLGLAVAENPSGATNLYHDVSEY